MSKAVDKLRDNKVFVTLFRVPTSDILAEIKYRLIHDELKDFKDISIDDLILYVTVMRHS